MNITFFIGNEVLNIFSPNIFSMKATFSEKMAKKIWGDTTIFQEMGSSYAKMNITFFITT